MGNTFKCYNRNEKGQCAAFTGVECKEDCPARITDINQKITMLKSMIEKANAKKLTRSLRLELHMALLTRQAIIDGAVKDWMKVYVEDLHRGSGGGSSESDSNRKTGLKQLMKDNRPVDVKPSRSQLEEYQEALAAFEEEHGKLQKLSRGQLSGSRIDSYTGLPVCIEDREGETCPGQKTSSGKLRALCKECPWRIEGAGAR